VELEFGIVDIYIIVGAAAGWDYRLGDQHYCLGFVDGDWCVSNFIVYSKTI